MWNYAKALDEIVRLKAWIKTLLPFETVKSPKSPDGTSGKQAKTAAAMRMRAKRKAERGLTEHRDLIPMRRSRNGAPRPFETARTSFEPCRLIGAPGCALGVGAKGCGPRQRGDGIAHGGALTDYLRGK
jgi:hypothetical protein